MNKLIDYHSPEKEILIERFASISTLDKWIATLIENYLFSYEEKYYKDGQCRYRYVTKNGQRHGEYKEWYENGQLCEQSTYVDGQAMECKKWYENGQLSMHSIYVDGQEEMECKRWYYINHDTLAEASFIGDVLHGEYKRWYDNGQLHIQYSYKNGKIHGSYKKWHKNGQLHMQATYVENKREGEHREWYENGKLSMQATFVRDKIKCMMKITYESSISNSSGRPSANSEATKLSDEVTRLPPESLSFFSKLTTSIKSLWSMGTNGSPYDPLLNTTPHGVFCKY